MAEIRPFRGVRYDVSRVGGLGQVIGPAEDIPSAERAAALTAGRPYNSVLLEMPEASSSGSATQSAGDRFRAWLRDGVLVRDGVPALYLYEHEYAWGSGRRRLRGFFAALRLTEPETGEVLPHESVLPQNLELRIAKLREVQADVSAVYTLVEDDGQIEQILDGIAQREPDESGSDDEGGIHRIWRIEDHDRIAALCGAVAGRPLYIADGHHRYEAALAYRDELRGARGAAGAADDVLVFIADAADPGIAILPIHRVVSGIEPEHLPANLETLRRSFELTPIEIAGGQDQATAAALESAVERLAETNTLPSFLLLEPGGERLWRLRLRSWEVIEPLLPAGASVLTRKLDVTVLDSVVLRQALGIAPDELERRVEFTPDIERAYDLVRAESTVAALFVRPTPLMKLLAVARAGERMPQKSTYFAPKIPIGLVVYDLRD